MEDRMLPEHFAEVINHARNLQHILVMRGWADKSAIASIRGIEQDLRQDLWERFEIQVP